MKLAVKNVIVVVLLHLSSTATAQEIIEVVDSISEDEMVVDTVSVDPYEGMIIETYYTDSGDLASDTIYLDDETSEWQKKLPQYDLIGYLHSSVNHKVIKEHAEVVPDTKQGI